MRIYQLLEDDENFYVVSEFMNHGELYEFAIDGHHTLYHDTMTETQISKIVSQIYSALSYMH